MLLLNQPLVNGCELFKSIGNGNGNAYPVGGIFGEW